MNILCGGKPVLISSSNVALARMLVALTFNSILNQGVERVYLS